MPGLALARKAIGGAQASTRRRSQLLLAVRQLARRRARRARGPGGAARQRALGHARRRVLAHRARDCAADRGDLEARLVELRTKKHRRQRAYGASAAWGAIGLAWVDLVLVASRSVDRLE
jgi:hypothetical protein